MEREYFGRTCRVIVELYPMIIRDCLQKQLPPQHCSSAAVKIKTLRPAQLKLIRNVGIRGDYGECDLSLMYTIASCACGSLPPPAAGWSISPITGTGIREKRRDLTQSYDKSPYTNRNVKRGKVTTQTTPQKSSIKQLLRTDLGRSVGVTTATQATISNE